MNLPSKLLIAFGVSYVCSPYLDVLIPMVAVVILWRFIATQIERSEPDRLDTLRRAPAPGQYGQLRRIK